MTRVFPPSTLAHPWREAFAALVLQAWFAVLLWAVFVKVVPWIVGLVPVSPWSFVPVTA